MRNIVGIILCACLLGCKAKKLSQISKEDPTHTMEREDGAEVLTVLLVFSQESPNEVLDCKITRTIKSPGRLKIAQPNPGKKVTDDICVKVLDERGEVINTFYMKNPLERRVEYVNDSGEFEGKEVRLKEEVVAIRFNYDPSVEGISIFSIKNNELSPIHRLKLSVK